MKHRRYAFAAAAVTAVVLIIWLLGARRSKDQSTAEESLVPAKGTGMVASGPGPASPDDTTTTVYAHNLELRKGSDFKVYVRWIRGKMLPTNAGRVPSLDDEESFVFHIDRGLIHANVGDIENYLNSRMAPKSPMKNMKLSGEGQQVKLSGTLHKFLVPLPIEIMGTLSPASNARVHLSVTKINVLKVPMKALMGGLKIEIKDVVGKTPAPGVEVSDNDIYLDTTKLLPPPHIRGQMSSITIKAPDLVVTYGDTTADDEARLAQWHNFLRLRGGSVRFGKLTMQQTDLTLIDGSEDVWFDLDLANYRDQLVKGYSRMTPEQGLELFMPDVGKALPNGSISLDTLRNRKKPLPTPVAR
jgi:hypothetical protein